MRRPQLLDHMTPANYLFWNQWASQGHGSSHGFTSSYAPNAINEIDDATNGTGTWTHDGSNADMGGIHDSMNQIPEPFTIDTAA